jgi:hypothetical protein
LHGLHVQPVERLPGAQRNGSSHPGSLPADGTTHHVSNRGMRHPITTYGAAGNQQITDSLRHERAIRNVKIPPRRGNDENAITVDELASAAASLRVFIYG